MENVKPITSLLIANPGEIARRINKTAQSLGTSTSMVAGTKEFGTWRM